MIDLIDSSQVNTCGIYQPNQRAFLELRLLSMQFDDLSDIHVLLTPPTPYELMSISIYIKLCILLLEDMSTTTADIKQFLEKLAISR